MTFLDRLRAEEEELRTRLEKLQAFMRTSKFYALLDIHKALLCQQAAHMSSYLVVLQTRIELWDRTPPSHPDGEGEERLPNPQARVLPYTSDTELTTPTLEEVKHGADR